MAMAQTKTGCKRDGEKEDNNNNNSDQTAFDYNLSLRRGLSVEKRRLVYFLLPQIEQNCG